MPTRNAPLVGIDSARRRLIGGPNALLEGEEVGGVPLVLDRLESLIVIAIVGFLPVAQKKKNKFEMIYGFGKERKG